VVSAVNAAGEGPNSAQVTVTMPNTSLPDVIVTAVTWTPNPAFTNNNVTFRATVKNQGTAPTPAGVTLGIGFSIDSGANVTWSSSYSSALAPGASVTLTANGGPTGSSTWKATPGMHTLTATADDINRFPESNEGNNAMSVNLAISSGPPKIGQISVATNNAASFSFSATAGIQYRVEYKNDLDDAQWTALGANIVASSNTVPVLDDLSAAPRRFYRVLQLN
jgi:subtilase family serine protease